MNTEGDGSFGELSQADRLMVQSELRRHYTTIQLSTLTNPRNGGAQFSARKSSRGSRLERVDDKYRESKEGLNESNGANTVFLDASRLNSHSCRGTIQAFDPLVYFEAIQREAQHLK